MIILRGFISFLNTYTLAIEGSKNGSLKNVVFKRVDKGFFAFVLEYIPNSSVLDYSLFSGSVKKFDLEGNLLGEVFLDKKNLLANGRTLACFADVSVECIEKIYDGYDHSTYGLQLWKCVKWATVITIDCMGDSQGGTTQVPYGSYIPDEYVGWGITGGDPISESTGEIISFEGSDPIGLIFYEPARTSLRARQLELIIQQNPHILLEIECSQLMRWQELTQHIPPQSVIDKVLNLKQNNEGPLGDWNIQYLQDAGGTMVNLDYWPVKVSVLPTKSDGTRFTPDEFLEYIRLNINDFIDNEPFEPYSGLGLQQQEQILWNSSNPMGSLIKINVMGLSGFDLDGNDGVVICSEKNNWNWKFMTLEAPGDWSHPVSGTRQFGYESNQDGSYTFFIRGVDRFTSNLQENVAYGLTIGDPFYPADQFWNSLQQGIVNFVNSSGGGSASALPAIKKRPDWNKVNDVLNGVRPISDLGCY